MKLTDFMVKNVVDCCAKVKRLAFGLDSTGKIDPNLLRAVVRI